jgi:acetate kinase
VLRKLQRLVPQAPLHTPALVALVEACQTAFPRTPVVLVFETAFFAGLPERERLYAVDQDLTKTPGLRRFGYHGILHAAACQQVARERKKLGFKKPARVLSICLEARPELAAVLGNRPLMVTSGATPLEGLPGQTTCGELDPSLVLMLAQKKGWGPEQINTVLTQESGWFGLVGRRTSLEEVLSPRRSECQLARKILQYRCLLACGAGLSALGGVDVIAFSGRCARAGVGLGLWLKKQLERTLRGTPHPITIQFCQKTLDTALAETVCAAVLGTADA